MSERPMTRKSILTISSLLMLPVLYVIFSTIHFETQGQAIEHWVPKWDRLLILVTIIGLERLYTYRYAVSQRAVLVRDIIANIYITGAVAAFLVLPVLLFGTQHLWGRKFVVSSPDVLGPVWLQIGII